MLFFLQRRAEEIARNLPPKISIKFNAKTPVKSKWEVEEEAEEAKVVQDGKAEWVEKPLSAEFKKKKAGVDWVEKSPSTPSADRSPNKTREKNYRARSKSRSRSAERKKR